MSLARRRRMALVVRPLAHDEGWREEVNEEAMGSVGFESCDARLLGNNRSRA